MTIARAIRALGRVGLVVLAGWLLACGPSPTPAPPRAGSAAPTDPPVTKPTTLAPGPARAAGQAPAGSEITVFAAASLTDAFKEIGKLFEATNPGAKVSFNFGASSQLRTQLEQGARADLFASANQAELDRARAAGIISGADRTFARNRLVVIFPRHNPGRIGELKDLARPGIKLVTAAPEVPIGLYTQDLLDRMSHDPAFGTDFKVRVNANVVSREPNVRQVVAKINLAEADAAVVYTSDVTPDVAANVSTLDVPDRFNTLATYPIAMVRDAPNAAGGEAFMTYVLGPDGQAVLGKWGFVTNS